LIGIKIGILSPNNETRGLLRSAIQGTGIAKVHVESEAYCTSRAIPSTRRFQLAIPDVIIVDLEDFGAALQSLVTLSTVLPKTWLFVISATDAPQLIIESMRAGAREYLIKNSMSHLAKALHRFLEEKKRIEDSGNPAGKIYCVMGAKGGSGTTSVAINLASVLSSFPESRTGLFDLNMPMGDTATYLNLAPQFTLSDVLESLPRLDPTLLETLMTSVNGLAVLPGPKEFRPGLTVEATARILDVASHMFTYVVVDGLQSLDQEKLRQVMEISTQVLIVFMPDVAAVSRTNRLLHFLETMVDRQKLRLVLNRASHKSGGISEKDIERVLKAPIDWKLPNDDIAAAKAIHSGRPLVELNHSELASTYHQFACKLTGVSAPDRRRKRFALF
jgi:pilus assembly protein CpaE